MLRRTVLAFACSSILGCSGGAASSSGPGAAAANPPCPDTAPAGAAATDPEVLALAAEAAKCRFENSQFDWGCPAYETWSRESDFVFEGPDANNTLLTMLEDDDIHMRVLAASQGFDGARAFLSNKSNAQRLFRVVDKEKNVRMLELLGRHAATVDTERVGLQGKFMALAKHPDVGFRAALAKWALLMQPTATGLAFTKKMLEDTDGAVVRQAIWALSGDGKTRASKEVCALLTEQMDRKDEYNVEALNAATTSRCDNMASLAMTHTEKMAASGADPHTLRAVLGALCWPSQVPESIKKRAFDVARTLAPKTEDAWDRRMVIGLFSSCDATRAKEALTPFLDDKDEEVVKSAKEELARLDSN